MLGANRSLLALIIGLRQQGVEVMVWCPKFGSFTEALTKHLIPFEVYAYHTWAAPFLHPGFWMLPLTYLKNKAMMGVMRDSVERLQPDVIHTNSSVLSVGAYLAEDLKIPHVWHIREFGRLDYNMVFFPGQASFYHWLAKAAKVIVISEAVREVVLAEHEANETLIYNGVANMAHFKSGKGLLHPPKEDGEITFLIIGILHPKKNQMVALQAFAKIVEEYPKARLLIVGKGQRLYEKQLRNFAEKHKLGDQVVFAGYMAEPEEAFRESDVVLMCSQLEAMGRVTVEAMAYGRPVIGFNSGGTPELITQGEDGFLYDGGPEELASCMRYFLRHQGDIRVMGRKGYEKAKTRFNEERYVSKMYKVFQEVVKEHKSK